MKNLFIYLTFIGLIGLLFSCEKDETRVVMLTNPIAPTITTLPDLTLKRAKGNDTLVFVGTAVDPGFQASATYFLEACAKGNNFKDAVVILSSVKPTAFKITVSNLNGIFLKKFPADQVSSVDLRIRSVLVVDAGTGALGTSTKPFEYISEIKNANVTVYGLPRLDLIGSGVAQKIESALGDGKYTGIVKLDKTKPFTLKDPDSNIVYGTTDGKLAVNGTGIIPTDNGWVKLNADTKALTYSMEAYMIGLVGSATPNAWNSPDQKMDYDAATGTWKITLDLVDGEIKFRLNDGWAWNLGGTPDNLTQGGANIAVSAGNYTITLTIIKDTTGTFKIVKN
ncbi:MAG: SusE domain-containing protein [Bacteroidota bacterium]|nr:SusE domain-containing protein [Bacteroidota bacterium]